MIDGEPKGEPLRQPTDRIVVSDGAGFAIKQLIEDDAFAYHGLIAYHPDHLRQHGDETADKYPDPESVRDSIVNPSNPRKLRFGIWGGDVMVGSNNLTPKGDGRAELGSWVGAKHVGKGYAGRARALLVNYAFNTLGMDEVFCQIVVGNDPSRRSVEKSGFEHTGTTTDEDGIHKWVFSLRRNR